MKQKQVTYMKNGFTLVEIVIVMAIIGILLSGAFFVYIRIIERSRVNQALSDVQAIRQAVEAYHVDLGFYPPDTTRGIDPGLATIHNPPNSNCGVQDCPIGYNQGSIADGLGNPVNWRGPYIDDWPGQTPWGGEYDYDYWPNAPAACTMDNGIYISIRPTLAGQNGVFEDAERYFMQNDYDADVTGCPDPNGNVHILIKRL